jgi:hypothetical protein
VRQYILDVRNKKKLTEELVNQLDPELGYTVKRSIHTWWFNIRNNGGMRLTTAGYRAFCDELDLTHYEFPINDPHAFNQQLILEMDSKLQMPYYISATKGIPKKIAFFGSQEAVMINLYGDLKKYLDNYQP